MPELEEFGIEEFGAESGTTEPQNGMDPAALKEQLDEVNKQLAATIDPTERGALQHAKSVIESQFSAFALGNKSEAQWADLSKAYFETHGNRDAFQTRLTELGGISDQTFETMREELSKHHQGKLKGKGGRKPAAKKESAPSTLPEPTPQSRWQHVLEHAKNLGFSAQVVFDELGFTEVTHETVSDTLREINNRAQPQTEVEEFGAGEPTAATAESSPAISSAPAAIATPSVPSASVPFSWDEALKRLLDPETGEVIPRGYFLEVLGWPELPTELTEAQADQILDVIHTRFIDPAKRYREQAEKKAAPLEKRAALWEEAFGPLLDKYGASHLPTHKTDSKPDVKKPHKAGDYSKKTLDFISGSISWTKDGGTSCTDEAKFHIWLAETKERLMILRSDPSDEAQEELKQLEETYGAKLATTVQYDRDKIKHAEQLPPGWETLKVNEFAKRTIK